MRVLLVTQNFYPEFFKSNDIASELVKRGNEVEVLTAIPNYPEGVYPKGYGVFKKRVDTYEGAKVYRAFQIPRGRKATSFRLAINYLSFVFTSTLWVLFFFVFKKKYDAIIIHQTSPITQAWPGILLGRIRKIPIYTWVLDIWPDSVLSTINTENILIKKPLDVFTDWVYRSSTKILISSPGFRELVNRNADYSPKIIDFPNWSDDFAAMPKRSIPPLPDGFIIMMAGNLSDAQGLESVIQAIKLTSIIKDIKWVFVGGGDKELWMRRSVKEYGLEENCYVLGRFPFDLMASFYEKADVMFLSLKESMCPHLNETIPARLQSYMSAGKPIVGMIGGGVSKLVEKINCGKCVGPSEADLFSKMILDIYTNNSLLHQWGQNAREYYTSHFTMKGCIDNLEKYLHEKS